MTNIGARQAVARLGPAFVVIVILLYLFVFAGDAFGTYFVDDEIMNLYWSWFTPLLQLLKNNVLFFSGAYRPFALLLYRVFFEAFGLHALPYRIVCFVFLSVNLGLLYAFCRRLSGSREVGVVACLLGAYHAQLFDLYYNAGTIFDLLCFSLYYVAFLYYLSIRTRGHYPGVGQSVTLLILYILALNSKEMAVTLPVWIASYELVFHPPRSAALARLGPWALREGRFLWMSIAVTLPYIAGKARAGIQIANLPDFHPRVGWNGLMEGWKHYLLDVSYGHFNFGRTGVIILWLALLILALVSRRRELRFAWLAAMTGVLPVIFIAPRSLYAVYMALPAFYLFAASSLLLLRDLALRAAAAISALFEVQVRQLALFLLVALALAPIHYRQKMLVTRPWVESEPLRVLNEYLTAKYPSMPRNANILFLSDPFPPGDWTLTMFLRLHYRDEGIQVDRVNSMASAPDPAKQKYLHMFALTAREIKEVTP
jgi:hypothetical protein